MNLWSFTDERQIAEDLVKNKKTINENTNEKIVAYIKYLKQDKKSKTDIRNELDDLMIKNYKGFIMADWDSKLQRYVNKYSKKDNCNYRTSKTIQITQKEIEFIKNIKPQVHCTGMEYIGKCTEEQICKDLKINLIFVPRVGKWSSTEIRKNVR